MLRLTVPITLVWKNEKFTLTARKFRQINSLVISLVLLKTVAFTKFLSKKCKSEFSLSPHCAIVEVKKSVEISIYH